VEVDAAPAGPADDAAVDETPAGPDDSATPARSGRPSRALLVVAGALAVLLVASAVVAALMYLKVRDQDRLDDNRRDAITAAEQFALRVDAFDGSDFQAYAKSIEPLLTTKERTEFSQQLQQFQQLLEQTRQPGSSDKEATPPKGKIQLAGATDVDEDSATVLVAHDAVGGSSAETLRSRWTVGMRKIDGDWLVDSFVPVS
jgi:Mce-associated membrane protein